MNKYLISLALIIFCLGCKKSEEAEPINIKFNFYNCGDSTLYFVKTTYEIYYPIEKATFHTEGLKYRDLVHVELNDYDSIILPNYYPKWKLYPGCTYRLNIEIQSRLPRGILERRYYFYGGVLETKNDVMIKVSWPQDLDQFKTNY